MRRLFGRKKGKKLRSRQAGLVTEALPALSVDPAQPIDPASLFPVAVEGLRLEIGFGDGENLARMALSLPQTGFIGCEPYVNGVAKMLVRLEDEGLHNVRLFAGDAAEVLRALPRGSLDGIDLFYPDPWPKRRQRQRRFVSDMTMQLMAGALRPGASLRFASDIDHYTGWMLAHAALNADLIWQAKDANDWLVPWDGWQSTRYEMKARREGRTSAYLTFTRR